MIEQLEFTSELINVFFLALYIASLKGDNHEVQKLLEDGYSVNLTYNSGKSNLFKEPCNKYNDITAEKLPQVDPISQI